MKALSLLLSLALAGAMPAEAAQVAGRVMRGPAAPLSLGATPLRAPLSAPLLSAPSLASPSVTPALPSPLVPGAKLSDAPRADAPQSNPAPQAQPSAPQAQPAAPEAPVAQEPALDAARHLAETPVEAPAAAAPEAGKARADAAFDGLKAKTTPFSAVRGAFSRAGSSLGRAARRALAAKPNPDVDEFGGPKHEPRSFAGRVAYGLKWGLNMTGITALLAFTLKPVLSALPWQLAVPKAALEATGRVELLTRFGPGQIIEKIVETPASFLGLELPAAVMMEELSYRVLGFGGLFLALAAIRPAARRLSAFLEELPALPLRRAMQAGLSAVSRVSSVAFPVAASVSALSFAVAHFAAWGINPYTALVHLSLGLVLSRVAYKTRSLSAPVAAHLSFNLISLGGLLLAAHFGLPQAALLYALGTGLLGIAALWYGWRTRAKARLGKTAVVAALIAALLPAAFSPNAAAPDLASYRPVAAQVQAAAPPAAAVPGAPPQPAAELKAEDIVRLNKPAVVMVVTKTGSGSGWIVSSEGFIVTNAHVVDGAGPIVMIRLNNGQQVPAKVLAANGDKDIAFLQLPPAVNGWPTVKLGDSGALVEGSRIVAMGYPLGLPFSVTEGIVSGVGFRGNLHVSHLQHDAAVNPGNSGGPLFNAQGEVIAMNTAIATQGGGFDGVSFAIPAADIQKAMAQFAAKGHIASSWLGVIVDQRAQAGMMEPVVRVEVVRPGSPADKAGLKAGDLIVGVGGEAFPADGQGALQGLARALAHSDPDAKVELSVIRQTSKSVEQLTIGVELGRRP